VGAADLPRRPLQDKFLQVATVPANACQRTKFQLSCSISFRDMRGVPKYNVGAVDVPKRPLADKFLLGAILPENAYQDTKFQLPSSNSFRDKEGVPKFNVGATTPLPYP